MGHVVLDFSIGHLGLIGWSGDPEGRVSDSEDSWSLMDAFDFAFWVRDGPASLDLELLRGI